MPVNVAMTIGQPRPMPLAQPRHRGEPRLAGQPAELAFRSDSARLLGKLPISRSRVPMALPAT